MLLLGATNQHAVAELRNAFLRLKTASFNHPICIFREYEMKDEEQFMLFASTDTGSLFTDGFGDGILLSNSNIKHNRTNSIGFGILQAARARITKN